MSIAEASTALDVDPTNGRGSESRGGDARGGDSRAGDRTPPQDLLAEQSVLGAMLMSKDAIADVVEVLRGADFYRPAHELVYDAVLDLYGRGEPADAVTVGSELTKRGELGRVGGAPYIHDLLASVSIAANAGHYADIVRQKAILRRLVDASIRIGQLSYAAEGEVDDIVDRAQAEVYSVTDRRTTEDYKSLSELVQPTMDEIEAIGSRGGQLAGVPTGFADLDELTNGMHPGQMVILAARPGQGKALAVDTQLPTPTGWTTMGEVQTGDQLIGADGNPTRVVAATGVMTDRDCYEITFSDGTRIVADAQHEWRATSRAARRAAGERRSPSYYFCDEVISQVGNAAETATDAYVPFGKLLDTVGTGLRSTLHAVRRQEVDEAAVATDPVNPRHYLYRQDLMLQALHRRVQKTVGWSNRIEHPETVTTADMAQTVRLADGRCNWAVETCAPVSGAQYDLLVPPYALGAWLGDGAAATAQLTSADAEIPAMINQTGIRARHRGRMSYQLILPDPAGTVRRCAVCGASFRPARINVRTCGRTCGGRLRFIEAPADQPSCPDCGRQYSGGQRCQQCRNDHGTVQARLRTLGVLGNKHIPTHYLRAPVAQRRMLLAGLLDTDGWVAGDGGVHIALTNPRLAADVYQLIVSLGYRCSWRTRNVHGRSAETSVAHNLVFSSPDDVFQLPRKRDEHRSRRTLDPVRTQSRYITAIRPVGKVPVRCVQVDNADRLYLASESMVPTHNSTLGLDLARAASIRQGLTSAIFSLEMSQTEIVMRLLSAEAGIPLSHIRNGGMTDDDWQRMAKKMGDVSEAPLFIDDSPNLTMMEIRAKARRLRQRHDLRLIVVDYLQLMTSGKKVESRQVEVSEFSRQLKLLAKELDLPVVALAQLNRGPETRGGDKKPLLSDLRESGCLTASTRVLRADTGTEITIGELMATGARNISVWSLDEHLRLVPRTMTHAFPSGTKETFRLRLTSGREVEATANHPFLTYDGWRPLAELGPGTRLAVPRTTPPPLEAAPRDTDEIRLLAHLLGDGSFVRRQPIRYASTDEANLEAVRTAAERRFGVTAVRDDYPAARVTALRLPAPYRLGRGRRNPVAKWLDESGLFGVTSPDKFVPEWVFQLPTPQIRMFIRHLWATDGSIRWDHVNQQARIYYASTSRRLVDDLSALLLRCGIMARTKTVTKAGYRDGFHLVIYGPQQQLRFCTEIGVHGARAKRVAEVAAHLGGARANNPNVDTVPQEVWTKVKQTLNDQSMTHREFAAATGTAFCGSTMWKHAPSRQRLGRVADVLRSAELHLEASNDVFWDEVAAVESLGEQPVYDATVPGTHNFVANQISVHNSLEQDADMVILLNRPDIYDKESERAGEADFDVAKHRNGPTRTVTVAFQGHYSRFIDMHQ